MIFVALFTLEALLKICAKGLLYGHSAYLRSGWNWLDLIVVLSGWLEVRMSWEGVMGLRLIRVVRPLRGAASVRGVRVLVECILSALPQCSSAVLVLLTLVLLFGTIGVHLFSGLLRHQCFRPTESGWLPTGDTCSPHCERDHFLQVWIGDVDW